MMAMTRKHPSKPPPPAQDAGNAGKPEPMGRPDSGRSKTAEVLEQGLPADQRRAVRRRAPPASVTKRSPPR
jgi:hypothetical protein